MTSNEFVSHMFTNYIQMIAIITKSTRLSVRELKYLQKEFRFPFIPLESTIKPVHCLSSQLRCLILTNKIVCPSQMHILSEMPKMWIPNGLYLFLDVNLAARLQGVKNVILVCTVTNNHD